MRKTDGGGGWKTVRTAAAAVLSFATSAQSGRCNAVALNSTGVDRQTDMHVHASKME
jgi:hypothetical protein